GGPLRGDPAADAPGGPAAHPPAARAGLPRQAAAALLGRDGELPALRYPRHVGAAGAGVGGAARGGWAGPVGARRSGGGGGGRRVVGGRAGLCAALVLCLTPGFVYRARMLTFDALLALEVACALAAAHLALLPGRLAGGWWLASALACGAGLLTKGPVALAL